MSVDRPTDIGRARIGEPEGHGGSRDGVRRSKAGCSRSAPATCSARAGSARTRTAGPATRRSPGTSTGLDRGRRRHRPARSPLSVHIPEQRPDPRRRGRPRSSSTTRASDEQQGELLKVFTGQLGGAIADLAGLIGEVVSVERVPITFTVDGGKGRLTIGDVADADLIPLRRRDRQDDRARRRPCSRRSRAPRSTRPSPSHFTRDGKPHGMPDVDRHGNNALQGHFRFAA